MINYKILSDSIDFYKSKGFERIETPWTVTEAVSNITKPPEAENFKIEGKNKCLVASAEQGFLYLYLKGFLPKGKFQSISPCFRDEPFDGLHTKYFLKNELIITDNPNRDNLLFIIETAREFFRKYCLREKINDGYLSNEPDNVLIREWPYNKNHFDLEYRGVELGSYGIRECSFLTWIYGTGVAEPRLSTILNSHGISF